MLDLFALAKNVLVLRGRKPGFRLAEKLQACCKGRRLSLSECPKFALQIQS